MGPAGAGDLSVESERSQTSRQTPLTFLVSDFPTLLSSAQFNPPRAESPSDGEWCKRARSHLDLMTHLLRHLSPLNTHTHTHGSKPAGSSSQRRGGIFHFGCHQCEVRGEESQELTKSTNVSLSPSFSSISSSSSFVSQVKPNVIFSHSDPLQMTHLHLSAPPPPQTSLIIFIAHQFPS